MNNWNDQQWKLYEATSITIRLADLDRFIDAMELLADGARLTEAARAAWETYIPDMAELRDKEYQKIKAA